MIAALSVQATSRDHSPTMITTPSDLMLSDFNACDLDWWSSKPRNGSVLENPDSLCFPTLRQGECDIRRISGHWIATTVRR